MPKTNPYSEAKSMLDEKDYCNTIEGGINRDFG
jgi:hypothetical protein